MPIPQFNEHGVLPIGKHICSGQEFIDSFCSSEERSKYESSIVNILDFASDKGATRIIVGGSFVTHKESPNDLDCLIIFAYERDIPSFIDCPIVEDIQFDILYSSEQMPKSIDSFIALLSIDRYGHTKGVIEILLNSQENPWKVHFTPNDDDLEILRRAYSERSIIERNRKRGLLISIHGINTNAKWNSYLSPLASSQGWIFAPFIYDNPRTLLFNPENRQDVIEEFRVWLFDLSRKYEVGNVSIVAHSFGTYIITKYISGFASEQFLPVGIDSLVLTGGIINCDYDWDKLNPCKVGRVLNIIADGDDAVKFMPETDLKKLIGMDTLFGKCGVKEFSKESKILTNRNIEILTHTNIFKSDFMETVLMPYLNVNANILNREGWKIFKKKQKHGKRMRKNYY